MELDRASGVNYEEVGQLSESSDNSKKHFPPSSCRKMLPESSEILMRVIGDKVSLNPSLLSFLESAVRLLYKGDYSSCLDLCQPALDKIWEELNTGYWKDVPLCWRQAYSLVSVIKALCEGALLSEPRRNIDHATILRTCDMGLLMGAPILGNILAKMSREFQQAFGILGLWRRQSLSNEEEGKTCISEKYQNEEEKREEKMTVVVGQKDKVGVACSETNVFSDHQEEKDVNEAFNREQKTIDNQVDKCSSPKTKQARLHVESPHHNEKHQSIDQAQSVDSSSSLNTDLGKGDGLHQVSGRTPNEIGSSQASSTSPVISLPPTVHTQKTSEIPCCSCPSVEMFQAMFMDAGHPVVITDAIGYWPALTTRRWTLEYLRSVAGCRTVPVEIGARYTEESWTQKLMTIGEMIDHYVTNPGAEKAYLAQHQLFDQVWELRDDISVPVYCCLGEDEDVDINAWFGPAGTISPLHQDPKHNFLCQVMGNKYVRLYCEEHSDCVYSHPTRLLHNTSQVDLDNPDLEQFPKFKDIPCLETVLTPGEMLYIPPRHWHYVKSLAVSFSVSFWWQ